MAYNYHKDDIEKMKKSGYTLVEVMIVVAVFGVLGAVIYNMASHGKDAAESVDVRARLTESARIAMTEIVRDLSETNSGLVTITGFTDPLNGEYHQILVFPSARGAPPNNDFKLDDDSGNSSWLPVWRSVIVYCTYVTPEGIQQLRKYVDYSVTDGDFPFSASVAADTINLQSKGGVGLPIARNSGSARANYITSEATGLADNNDGFPDNGADFTLNGSLVTITLFLSKRELSTKGGTRRLTITLTDSVVMKN